MAYTVGLIPFILIRSVVAPFLARGDTATPVKAALLAASVNIALKVLLMGMLAPPNLGADYRREFDAIYPALARKHRAALVPRPISRPSMDSATR